MSKIIERCAGIDIGKRFLMCCVVTGAADEESGGQTLRFDTTVPALERMRGWLSRERVTHVVMESTGSYWVPVFNILEEHFTVVLANPEEVKNRKGHKTDRNDAKHLADLLRHDHIRPSYIPPKATRELRDLTRRRVQLMEDSTRERNRVQKLLEHANVKIAGVPVPDMDPHIAAGFRNPPTGPLQMWPLYAQITGVPQLVIRGALSDLLSAATVERMAREKPDLEQLTVANRGHVPLLDEPECLAAIDAFLTRHGRSQ